MSKNQLNNNYLLCLHSKTSKENNDNNIVYTYCEQCGSLSIKKDKNFYCTIKPKQKQKPIEINPIIITKNMKKKQDLSYPCLENIYQLNINQQPMSQELKDKINIYFTRRKLILLYLQNITRKLSYSDLSFYHCLFLVDLYLSHNITEDMSEEELLYILVGFFLVSSKFKETDIFEPELVCFNNIDNNNINLSIEKVKLYEAKFLKYINYNFFLYSTYDWLNIFMSNGYIFDGEIDEVEYISVIHTYTYRILITVTPKNIFIKYSPLYMAITIIHITREDKIDKDKINNELFNDLLSLYEITFKDYENCYKEIKSIINRENSVNNIPKLQNIKIDTFSRNQTPNSDRYENKITEKEKENEDIPIDNKNEKQIIDISKQSKLNLKKKLKDIKIKQNFISSTGSAGKTKKNFHSIIVNNMKSKKNHNFNTKKKNLEIIEYINSNLPIIYINGNEANKVFKTENETITGSKFKILKVKNEALNNLTIKNKIIKNRGTSFDTQNLKKISINNNKAKISPLKLSKFMRNGTYDTFRENDKKISKLLYKNNTNIYHTDNNSSIFNKNNDYLKHYNNTNSNSNNHIDIQTNFILKNYLGNSNNKISITNNINIYKNYSNIYNNNNNIKSLYRQSTSDYFEGNEIMNSRIENQHLFLNNTKNIGGFNIKGTENIKKKEGINKINSAEVNYLITNNKKNFLSKLKLEKNNLNNDSNLLSLKKSVFKNNTKLPKLKLKIEK